MPRNVIVALARAGSAALLALGLASCERWPERAPVAAVLESAPPPAGPGAVPPSRPTPLVTE